MKKKTFELVVGIVNGVGVIADAVVVFCVKAPLSAAIVASIGIATTAVTEICSKFVKAE